MTDEIKHLIAIEAEKEATYPAFSGATKIDQQKQLGYIAGATKWASMMEEFAEWMFLKGIEMNTSGTMSKIQKGFLYKDGEGNLFTASELLTIFLKTKH